MHAHPNSIARIALVLSQNSLWRNQGPLRSYEAIKLHDQTNQLTVLRRHDAAELPHGGSRPLQRQLRGGKKTKRVKNPLRAHITRSRGDPELTALQGSHEPATGWEPKRWGARSSSARRGLSNLTETKSWSEIPPELAIAGEFGAKPFS